MRFSLPQMLVAASFALAPLAMLTAPSAAHAQRQSTDYRCTGLAQQAQAAVAAATDASMQARARRSVSNGQLLCNAGNAADAGRQYRAALRVLGVQEVAAEATQDMARR